MNEPNQTPDAPTQTAPLAVAPCWPTEEAFARNQLVGEALGMRPVTQCWIGIGEKKFWITPHTEEERDKAQALIDYFTKNDENWAHFVREKKGAIDEMRDKLAVVVERWHIRYSDTPGGGWKVVEWLHKLGPVNVASVGAQWRVAFGEHAETAPTMAEAACLIALRVCSANTKSSRGTAQP